MINRKSFFTVASIGLLTILSGCTTNIAKLPVTDRDHQTYDNKYAEEFYSDEKSEALNIVVVPQDPAMQGEDKRTLESLKSLTNSFGDGLETAFSNLSDFDVIPRSELGAIIADKELASMSSGEDVDFQIKNANYMIVYRISSYNFKQFTSLLAKKDAPPSYKAYVKVKVSLINTQGNVKEFTKTITGESQSSSESQTIGLLNQAIESAVRDFSTQFAVDYAPPAIVQQTKGSGKVALINVGKDYGLMKNMKVEFFMFKEKRGKRLKIPFAYGKIIEIGAETAWVEVNDFDQVGVKENHFARVRRDQSKSFMDALAL